MTRRRALAALAAMPAWGRPRPPLERTFLQPWRRHLDWTDRQWSDLLEWLRALAVRELVLQWTSWNSIDYSPLAARLAPLLSACKMKLWLGLAFSDDFWHWPVHPGPDLDTRLEDTRRRSLLLAAQLAAGPALSKSFAGWYLPEEFDAARWGATPETAASHLRDSRNALRRLRPAPVAVSGFPSSSPEQAARFWSAALPAKTVDQLWLQDGIGAGKATLDSWPDWAAKVASALRPSHCRLSVIVETFQSTDQPGFSARPAPSQRLLLQIAAARRLTREPLAAFAIPDYMSPPAGAPAVRLARDYAAAFGLRLPADLPSNPTQSLR